MEQISVNDLHRLCTDDTIIITKHLVNRCRERNIEYDDIKQAIMTCEIIEQYPDDFPYPSCLVLGTSVKNMPMHIVVGIQNNNIWIITVYYPSNEKWMDDLKTRRRQL